MPEPFLALITPLTGGACRPPQIENTSSPGRQSNVIIRVTLTTVCRHIPVTRSLAAAVVAARPRSQSIIQGIRITGCRHIPVIQ